MFNERIIERSYASKHLKRCSKSSAIKETHIKRNTIRYTSYLLGWLQSKEKEKRKEQWIIITSDEKIWTNWNPNTFLSGMGQPIWKTVWYFLTRLKRITIGSSKSIVRYILKGNENMSTKNLCTNVHSNIIHNSQKGETTHCPSTDEWEKMWYIHSMGYYSTVRRMYQFLL